MISNNECKVKKIKIEKTIPHKILRNHDPAEKTLDRPGIDDLLNKSKSLLAISVQNRM